MIRLARSTCWLLFAGLTACGSPAPPERPQSQPQPVRTTILRTTTAERSLTAIGTLEPVAKVSVASQAEGLVTRVTVREGDPVRSGQLLVLLDDRELQAQLQEAEASAEEAEARWQRTRALRAEGFLSAAEEDTARATVRIANARADLLRTRLGFTRISAPVDGVVVARQVEVGDLASPRSPLLELAAGEGLLLRLPVSELEVVHLATDDRARITVDALPGLELEGHITRIYPSADPGSRQVTVEIMIDDPPASVRIGFLARARMVLERRPDSLVVSEDLVQRGAEAASFVWVAEGDAARMRPVELGWRLEQGVLVTAGLAAGDEVIVEGRAALRDGAPIRRLEPAAESAP
jgi:RND family efflux transporter MFP subunit